MRVWKKTTLNICLAVQCTGGWGEIISMAHFLPLILAWSCASGGGGDRGQQGPVLRKWSTALAFFKSLMLSATQASTFLGTSLSQTL